MLSSFRRTNPEKRQPFIEARRIIVQSIQPILYFIVLLTQCLQLLYGRHTTCKPKNTIFIDLRNNVKNDRGAGFFNS